MPGAPILDLQGVTKSFLHRPVLRDVSLTIHEGDRIGLLGLNGSGKSTLMRIIAGVAEADAGELHRARDLTVSYLDQVFDLEADATIGQWLDRALAPLRDAERRLHDLHDQLAREHGTPREAELLERISALSHDVEMMGAYDAEARVESARRALGLPEPGRKLGELSGGERRRVALCRTLLEGSRLLLLDEPTNHLDAETLEWLENFLRNYPGTLVLVTHDRYFLDRVVTRMFEVDRGRVASYDGNYEDYLLAKEAESGLAAREESNRQRLLRRELAWLGRQPRARTTKSKARIDRVMDLVAAEPEAAAGSFDFRLPDPPHIGNTVLEVEGLRRAVAGRELIGGLTFTMNPRERLCIVGPNGAGKTTLVRLLLGLDQPDAGRVVRGRNVQVIYADQERLDLDPAATVLDEVAGEADWLAVGGERITVRAYLKRFLFSDETAAMPVGKLSGGERNRVLLAKLLKRGGNFVALDEPTNDLDLQTLRVLEEALVAYDGCALVVSHDRYFINRVATRILWLPGTGEVHSIMGNYDDFLAYRARLREAAAESRPAARAQPAPDAPPVPARAPAASRKLSYKEQREFEGIEQAILEAEENLATLNERLNNPATFAGANADGLKSLVADRDAAEREVERLYARWSELGERA